MKNLIEYINEGFKLGDDNWRDRDSRKGSSLNIIADDFLKFIKKGNLIFKFKHKLLPVFKNVKEFSKISLKDNTYVKIEEDNLNELNITQKDYNSFMAIMRSFYFSSWLHRYNVYKLPYILSENTKTQIIIGKYIKSDNTIFYYISLLDSDPKTNSGKTTVIPYMITNPSFESGL